MEAEADRQLRHQRQKLLESLSRELHDARVLDAIAGVPREAFVPPHLRGQAYDDRALPIGEGQTISQPLMVALMVQALDPRPHERILEVGTGSGYAAAVLGRLAHDVVTVERNDNLLGRAVETLGALGFTNVSAHLAGEQLGWPGGAPYDGILVSAGAPHVPRALLEQLASNGRLVIPVGTPRSQELVSARNTPHGVELRRHGPCAFVPLIGEEAWRDAG